MMSRLPSFLASTCSRSLSAAAVSVALVCPALAQKQAEPYAAGRTALPTPVGLERLDILPIVLRPSVDGGEGGGVVRGPGCPVVTSSHTAADFSGGTYVAQAGFVQGEIAAASYTLPAAAFPIKIELMEWILVTSGATQQTTTQWSVLVWEGTPQTGTLVASYSSDDLILPHARVGPGTAGVNIQVSVDPNDPEQIYVLNTGGSNIFSIGFRIDQAHQPPANPCLTAPATCCNAFPCTDTGGLQQPANNWLNGLNCGPFGCPANGGWARFSTLPSFCRPSGDWVMRASWSSVNCVPPSNGSCCAPIGSCTVTTQANCASGSVWTENGTCGVNPCTQPTARCCLPNGSCQVLLQTQCSAQQGVWAFGQTCAAACPQPTGACCFGASCQIFEPAVCAGFGGVFIGINVACGAGGTCPLGACCLPNGSCLTGVSDPACTGQGGTFQGVGSTCTPNNCPQPVGACCASNNFCFPVTQASCAGIPGTTWQGPLTTCNPNLCGVAQTGACCTGGICIVTDAASCAGGNNSFQGPGSVCNSEGNNTEPCCRADFDQNGTVAVPDIFAFLASWFAGADNANFDGMGVDPTVPDIFAYLGAWFAGCD